MNPIIQAAQIAAELHVGQLRKWTGRPYIEHPARVAGRACLIPNVPEHVVAAAWLHDVLEDCNVTVEELRSKINPWTWASEEAVKLVVELTNPSKGSKAASGRAQGAGPGAHQERQLLGQVPQGHRPGRQPA